MAELDPRTGPGRLPSLPGRFIVDTYRGKLRVRAWPRPKGKKWTPQERYWQDWFRQANILAKYAIPEEQIAAREATKNTPWLPRDLLLKAMRGRLWSIGLPDGRVLYSEAVYMDISQRLDVISQYDGSLIVRDQGLWKPLLPGPEGFVLTSRGEGLPPAWAPQTGGGTPYTPPSIDLWPEWVNQQGATIEQARSGTLILSRPPVSTSATVTLRVGPLPTPPRRYTFGIKALVADFSGDAAGIFLRDSSTGRLLNLYLRWDTAADTWSISADQWNSPTSYNTSIRRVLTPLNGPVFLRLTDDGTNLIFEYSLDDGSFAPFATAPRTAWLANPDQFGIGLASGASQPATTLLAVFHYRQETL